MEYTINVLNSMDERRLNETISEPQLVISKCAFLNSARFESSIDMNIRYNGDDNMILVFI
jgi:hypothetical protein